MKKKRRTEFWNSWNIEFLPPNNGNKKCLEKSLGEGVQNFPVIK